MSCQTPASFRFARYGALLSLPLLWLPTLANAQAERGKPKQAEPVKTASFKSDRKSGRILSLAFPPQPLRAGEDPADRQAVAQGKPAGGGQPEQMFPVPDVAANYGFSTTTTGSLTDMSSGTTTLIGPNEDDTASAVTLIGFDFFFQGARQDRFSVNSNGTLRFGTTQILNTLYNPLGQTGQALITAYGADQRTVALDGKVHFKVIGTAPNRVLVIEWLNMQCTWPEGGTPDLTYQVRLSETTGAIEFVYGQMTMTAGGVSVSDSRSPQFGFSSGSTTTTVGSITAAQSGTPAPSFSVGTATPVDNEYAEGPITVLSSATDGARRTFTFQPPTPNPPGGPLTFTAITLTGMTLNWTDSSNELIYAVYNSTDGVNFNFVNTAAANATSLAVTGLVGETTYHWRVHAVSEGAFATLSGTQATASPTVNMSVGAGGDWNNAATWSAGIPNNTHAVTISSGTSVRINATAAAYSVTVDGTLQYEATTARPLTVSRDVTINSGGTFQSNAAGTQTGHTLSLTGNLTNNGTLDFSTNADTAGAGITFTGTNNSTFGGTGGVTDVRTINVNKGTNRTPLLELIPTNFTVRGVTTDTVAGGWLVMNNGTIRVGGTFSGTSRVFATSTYAIPATFGFWLDNPNYVVAAQAGNNTHLGLLRISQGTFNQGTTAAHRLRANNGAVFTLEGGTVNCSGQFSPQQTITYNQSGGTLNVGLVGNNQADFGTFELFSQNTVFNMTGGSIVIHQVPVNGTPIAYRNISNVVAGRGNLQFGSANTATNFNFQVLGYAPNVVIDNTGSPKQVTTVDLFVAYGSTTINPGTTLTFNGLQFVAFGAPFTNNGTLTGTTSNSRLYFFGDSIPSVYTGSGVVTAPLVAIEIDNSFGLTIDPAVNQITALQLDIYAGGVTNANKLTLGNGGASTAILQLGTNGVTRPVVGVDVTPTYNPGTGGISIVYDQELSPRTTGAELPPDRTVTTLVFRNDTTIAGGDVTVTSLLDLTATRVTTGTNTLSLVGGASVIRNDTGFGYVTGNLRKVIPGAGSGTWRFEVGAQLDASSGYGPVEFVVSSGTFPATVTVSTSPGRPAFADPFLNALSRSWKITCDTDIVANTTFRYLPWEPISTYAEYLFLKLQNGAYSTYTPSVAPTDTASVLNNAVFTGVSEWTMVEPTSPSFLNVDTTVFVIGQSNTFSFSAIGAPMPTLSLDPASDPLPDGVSFNASTGVLSGNPAPGTQGDYLVIVTAANGTFDMQQYFHLIVSDTANQNPVANADVMGTRQGVPASVPAIRLMINDRDPDGDTLSITGVSSTSAQGGSVTHCGCFEVVTYYPPTGFSGNDSFTYTLSDGRGGLATGTVNVTVIPSASSGQNITGLSMPGGVPTVTAYGIPGRIYRLEYTDNMGGAWATLSTQQAAFNGAIVLSDPTTPLPPNRFYRIVEDF